MHRMEMTAAGRESGVAEPNAAEIRRLRAGRDILEVLVGVVDERQLLQDAGSGT